MTSKTIAIHQPNFMPWMGYFDKVAQSDLFVFFDDVQFPKGRSFVNRVLIKTNTGSTWLNVPIKSRRNLRTINTVEVDNSGSWKEKMLKTIGLVYKRTPYFEWLYPELVSELSGDFECLSELNISLIIFLSRKAGLATEFAKASELPIPADYDPSKRIPEIVRYLHGTLYLSGKGKGSMRYISEDIFSELDIQLEFQEFVHPIYTQPHGAFIPNMSFIDVLFACGPEAGQLLKAGRSTP